MNKKTERLTLLAVFTALSLAFMFLSSVFPMGQMGVLAVASLFGIAAVVEYGIGGGALVYAASAILGFLIIPDKSQTIIYTTFFGYYPVIKHVAEKQKSRIVEWAIKLVVFNAALCVVLFAFSITIFDLSRLGNSYLLVFALCNVVFVIFDFGVTKLIAFYTYRIHNRIHRR